jgi:hypothetical protein
MALHRPAIVAGTTKRAASVRGVVKGDATSQLIYDYYDSTHLANTMMVLL